MNYSGLQIKFSSGNQKGRLEHIFQRLRRINPGAP